MTHPIYNASIPVFRQMLGSLKDVLAKTEAHATARKIEPDAARPVHILTVRGEGYMLKG